MGGVFKGFLLRYKTIKVMCGLFAGISGGIKNLKNFMQSLLLI